MVSKSEISCLYNQSLRPLHKTLSSTEHNLWNTDSFLQCLWKQKAYAWRLSPVTRSSSLGKAASITSLILGEFFFTLCQMCFKKVLPNGPSSGLWHQCPHLHGRRQLMCSHLGLPPSCPSAPKFFIHSSYGMVPDFLITCLWVFSCSLETSLKYRWLKITSNLTCTKPNPCCLLSPFPKPGQWMIPLSVQCCKSEIYITSLISSALHFPYWTHH